MKLKIPNEPNSRFRNRKNRLMSFIILGFVLMISTTSCHSEAGRPDEAEKLLATDREFSALSVEKGAAEAFHFYLLPEALQLPHGGLPIFTRDSIYNDMLPADADFELKWEPQSAEVSGSGDMGYTWGFYTLSAKQYGYKILVRRGKYLNIWKKDDQNQWRVMVDMGNHNPPE